MPDSSGTASAIFTGVKTRRGTVAVTQDVVRRNCSAVRGREVKTILELAREAGEYIKTLETTQISTKLIKLNMLQANGQAL